MEWYSAVLLSLTPFPVIVTSGPSAVWPKKAYRNPLDQLVAFLDRKHGEDWSIFEFRAEGTGYPDSEVYNRIHHFPWPDHHPPPFAIIPNLMAAMRNWIQRTEEGGLSESRKRRVAVVHCKAGKGRSGTVACSYLISQEGWKKSDALQRFTERRMRVGFGQGVSIPSQLRWVGYVDRWTNSLGKRYVERPVEIVEVHVYGLRDGVKVSVEGYVDNGRKIKIFHTFSRQEKIVMEERKTAETGPNSGGTSELHPIKQYPLPPKGGDKEILISSTESSPPSSTTSFNTFTNAFTSTFQTVLLRPSKPIVVPTSDVNIDFERRSQASNYTGFTMVTSIAHVWFNTYFEGGSNDEQESGVFEIDWEAMDGIKGSLRKGVKALDRLKVVWRYAKHTRPDAAGIPATAMVAEPMAKVITEPEKGEPVQEGEAADWRGEATEPGAKRSDRVDSGRSGGALLTMGTMIKAGAGSLSKELGLRPSDPGSAEVSRAPSEERGVAEETRKPAGLTQEVRADSQVSDPDDDDYKGVRVSGPEGEDHIDMTSASSEPQNREQRRSSPGRGDPADQQSKSGDVEETEVESRQDTRAGRNLEVGMGKVATIVAKMKHNQDSS